MSSHKDKILEILKQDLLAFGAAVSPQTFYLPPPDVHKDIATLFLDNSQKQLNIIAPRGIAKTTLVTMLILHHLFLSKTNPGEKRVVVVVSKTQSHAKSILSTIKNILNFSAGFRDIFGYFGEQTAKTWREDMITLSNGDGVLTRGTRQPIRGVNIGLQRPTLIIIDDPEDENNTKTIEAMVENLNWILQGAAPSVDTIKGRVIVVGTPLHEKCIVMQLGLMSDWKTVHFGNDLENGVALWPESRSLEWLREKKDALKAVGLMRVYYQEYECKLIPGTDALFQKDYLKFYHDDMKIEMMGDENYLRFPSGLMVPVSIYMGVDPASSIKQSADYSAIVVIAVTKELDIYVIDYYMERVPPLDLATAIEAWYLKWKPRLTLIESNNYQDMLRSYMRTRLFIPGLEIKEDARDKKSVRLEMLQPFFAQGKVWLKKSQTDLQDQLLLFPKCTHDDLLDGLYYACKRMRAPIHQETMVSEPLPEHQQVYVEYYEKKEEDSLPTYYDPFA